MIQIIKNLSFNKKIEYLLTFCFALFVSIFWGMGYPYTLKFQEPLQLFLFSTEYFFNSVKLAGGLSGYLGEFFTQFYFLSWGGTLVMLFLLLVFQRLTLLVLREVTSKEWMTPLSFVPAVWYCTVLSEEFYLLSGLISLIISLCFLLIYIQINSSVYRAIAGFLFIPAAYWTAGGSFFLFFFSVACIELFVFKGSDKKKISSWLLLFMGILTVLIPLINKQFYDPVPFLQSYITEHFHKISTVFPFPVVLIWLFIPVAILLAKAPNSKKRNFPKWLLTGEIILLIVVGFGGHKLFAAPSAEYIKKMDFHVREKNWDEIIKMSEDHLPRNAFAVNYTNLALAKKGKLGDRVFDFEQLGPVGLFLPYERELLSAMIGNETLYHLGLVNASQQYIFEATEAMPDLRKSTRSLKRLTEIAIINEHNELALKYINMLKQTLFYSSWAETAEACLYDEDKVDRHPDWGEKRKFRPEQDYFFSLDNIDQILISLLQDHPQHKMAFEYLTSYYLVNKDIKSFMNVIHLGRPVGYKYLPVSCQEAVLYVLGSKSEEAVRNNPYPINPATVQRLYQYINIYTNHPRPRAKAMLEKDFDDTFWYYFHFK